ncbi:oxidoreductase [Streptomyces pluripotens]|uniref:Oxidoreductase n=1 Tax=Streptomyces pluripotens TaxID=1355015 RepID=A0A221NZB2_9ACTN|nr:MULTISPECIES: oxidoreductase [Streptomyces]ARP71050.1 oxidoreductase [Streptomyces pluripotens]ASN25300.1 oxidoreductase [Streptomyces pluripotens]KIE25937.1 oxidoreductase [Streptomyces sp. MUSC 125]MCH0557180.1 oxidoreductase [Streptomyces sp. MUM 16J]
MGLLRKIRRTGRVAEPAPPPPEGKPPGKAAEFGGSVQVRCVDAGSCNGCEIEIAAAFNPVYDADRYGARLVASPRHADVALVTGPVTRNMAEPLRRTVAAMGEPRLVVAVGDCALDCGEFAGGYGVEGAVSDVVPVDLAVPGCPPEPAEIVAALRKVTGR